VVNQWGNLLNHDQRRIIILPDSDATVELVGILYRHTDQVITTKVNELETLAGPPAQSSCFHVLLHVVDILHILIHSGQPRAVVH